MTHPDILVADTAPNMSLPLPDVCEILASLPLFQSLPASDLNALAEQTETVSALAESIVFHESDEGDALYVILKGTVRLVAAGAEGQKVHLADLEAGDFFGEQALLENDGMNHRNATAMALEDCEMLRVEAVTFRALVKSTEALQSELKKAGEQQIRHKLFKQSMLFQTLSTDDISDCWMEEKHFADGEAVFRAGDPSENLYLILAGTAQVIKKIRGAETLLALLSKGHYFGERALLKREPHSAEVRAKGHLHVVELHGEKFLALYGKNPQLRDYMAHLSGFYHLSGGGAITLHPAKFMGMESVTAVYHQSGGVKITSTKVIHKAVFQMNRLDVTEGHGKVLLFEQKEPRILRELRLHRNRLVAVTAIGLWSDLGRIHKSIVEASPVFPWQLALFRQNGELWLQREQDSFDDNAIVCKCAEVSRGTLNEALACGCGTLEDLAKQTGASLVCGACFPQLAEIIGNSDMQPAQVLQMLKLTSEVKAIRFRPKRGKVKSSLPGQHLRIEAQIQGRWVQRSYTLTSPPQADYYEITVKREAQGLFSRHLHTHAQDALLRISQPQGNVFIDPACDRAVICFCAGIGITPALAILRHLIHNQSKRFLMIDYSANDARQFVCRDELEAAACDQIQVVLRNTSQEGRIRAEHIILIARRYPSAEYFVCGPQGFEQSVRKALQQTLMPPSQIKVEHFSPPVGDTAGITEKRGMTALWLGSLAACLLMAVFFMPGVLPPLTKILPLTPPGAQQLTGYTLLALFAAGALIALQKRYTRLRWGDYIRWRNFHIAANLLALCLLILHTGQQHGHNFNFFLFLLLGANLLSGALNGLFTVATQHYSQAWIQYGKTWLGHAHLALSWPLPAMVLAHIVAARYF